MNEYDNYNQKFYEKNGYILNGGNPPSTGDLYGQNPYPQPGYGQTTANTAVKAKARPGAVVVIVMAIVFGFIGGMLGMYIQPILFGDKNKAQDSASALSASSGSEVNDSLKTININNEGTFPVAAISEKVSPSVVGIRVTSKVMDFFRNEYEATEEGSGVIYSEDGYIITNHHVIASAVDNDGSQVMVYLPGDMKNPIEAEIVGYDMSMDLALLKIEKTGLQAADLGDSDSLQIGDISVAIGNPGGLEFMGSTSFGVIGGLNRTIKLESGASLNVIQTDAAINPGNSGGALADADGKVIGINSAKLTSEGFEGMGFALPINEVIEVCERIINHKGSALPYIGIQEDQRFNSEILTANGYPEGVVIGAVVEGAPAEVAGIRAGDIITKFNGIDTPNINLLNNERNKCIPGDVAVITIFRDGTEQDVEVVLAESMV